MLEVPAIHEANGLALDGGKLRVHGAVVADRSPVPDRVDGRRAAKSRQDDPRRLVGLLLELEGEGRGLVRARLPHIDRLRQIPAFAGSVGPAARARAAGAEVIAVLAFAVPVAAVRRDRAVVACGARTGMLSGQLLWRARGGAVGPRLLPLLVL